jgi:hypothetical protein
MDLGLIRGHGHYKSENWFKKVMSTSDPISNRFTITPTIAIVLLQDKKMENIIVNPCCNFSDYVFVLQIKSSSLLHDIY